MKGTRKIVAALPLQFHNFYGETVLYINEMLDHDGTQLDRKPTLLQKDS